jgi:hypothetical protein
MNGLKGQTQKFMKLLKAQYDTCCNALCDFPIEEDFEFPVAENGVPFLYDYTLNGEGPFNFIVISKPSWMVIAENDGVLSFSGTPTGTGNFTVSLRIAGCDQNVNLVGQVVVFELDSTDQVQLIDFEDQDVSDYPVGVFNVDEEFIGHATTQQEYIDIWNADPANAAVGSLAAGETSSLFIFTPVNSSPIPSVYGLPYVVYPLTNFDDNPVPSAPYGLFQDDETFIGLANSGSEAATNWNNTSAYFDVAFAQPVIGSDVLIGLYLKDINAVVPDIRALRYWNITGTSGSPVVYLSADTIVRTGAGTQIKSEVGGVLGVVGAASFGTNTTSLSGGSTIDLVDSADVFYKVTLTTGVNRIFHNETGLWAWMDVFAVVSNNGGYVPPTLKYIAMQSFGVNNTSANLSVANFLNANTALTNVITAEFNGAVVNPAVSNTKLDVMPNLQHFFYIETGGPAGTYPITTFGLSAAEHPDLQFIAIRRNNSAVRFVGGTLADYSALPELLKGGDFQGARIETAAGMDDLINGLATVLTNPAVATAVFNMTQNPAGRTTASDASHAAIEALGYNITGV